MCNVLYQQYLQLCFPSYWQQAVCICNINTCPAILPSLENESAHFTVSVCLKNLLDIEAEVFSMQAQNHSTTCQKNIQYLLKLLHSCNSGLFLGLNLAELHTFMLYMLNILGNKKCPTHHIISNSLQTSSLILHVLCQWHLKKGWKFFCKCVAC